MEIRALQESDAPAWWQIRLESLESDRFAFGQSAEEHRAIPIETIAERFRTAPPCNLHLGAFEDGALIGIATFIRDRGHKDGHKGRIYGVYVSRAHRGKNIGRALLTRLIETARQDASLEQILLAVATTQTAAASLYRSLGFEKFGTEPKALKNGATYIDEDHMILHLR